MVEIPWYRMFVMFVVSFYSSVVKTSPVKEFINSCKPILRAKILRKLKYVQEFGLNPAIPDIKKVTGTQLWELRILGKDNIRLFCASLPNREVKVLHIIKKKKQKTPIKEISIAISRYKELTNDI